MFSSLARFLFSKHFICLYFLYLLLSRCLRFAAHPSLYIFLFANMWSHHIVVGNDSGNKWMENSCVSEGKSCPVHIPCQWCFNCSMMMYFLLSPHLFPLTYLYLHLFCRFLQLQSLSCKHALICGWKQPRQALWWHHFGEVYHWRSCISGEVVSLDKLYLQRTLFVKKHGGSDIEQKGNSFSGQYESHIVHISHIFGVLIGVSFSPCTSIYTSHTDLCLWSSTSAMTWVTVTNIFLAKSTTSQITAHITPSRFDT